VAAALRRSKVRHVSRLPTFKVEAVSGIRGLTSLTEPDQDEPVGAIVDVAVIGARGDGKTQFIVHAIRTLRAYAPLLEGAEHQYNRDVLQVVMNAREPRPEATAPGVIPHYVFRIRPGSLLSQVGLLGRLALYGRVAGLWPLLFLALLNAAALAGVLSWLRGGPGVLVGAAAVALFALGALIGVAFARRRFVRRGDIEIVFWDVAGEHVYSDSAADYYSFLGALVRMRRQRASAARSYAFAPVLICNPMSLGARVEGSSYARLKQLMPLFASLNEPLPRAMVAINRWSVVEQVCAPDSDREEIVAVVSRARSTEEEDEHPGPAPDRTDAPRSVLPAVKREVVRKHCLDAEDGLENDVHLSYLRYDAGIQCEFRQRPWDWSSLESELAGRWRAPTSASPDSVLDYGYEDGPGSFTGEVRRAFLNWVAALAFHEASYGPERTRAQAADLDIEGVAARVRKSPAEVVPERAHEAQADPHDWRPDAQPAWAPPRPGWRDVESQPDAQRDMDMTWQAMPLSATGLEEFARGTIAKADAVSAAIDASLDRAEASADPDDAGEGKPAGKSLFRRESTAPGIGPQNVGQRALTPAPGAGEGRAEREPGGERGGERGGESGGEPGGERGGEPDAERTQADARADEPSRRHTSTLRMPGGFGSGGT
jgi:hypothetical protein